MSGDELTLEGTDAHRIHAYRWPVDEPRGLVQIVHGMAEHAARYAALAETLNEAGWAVIAHDHRGHGKSAKRDTDLGHFADRDGWRRVLEDVRVVRERGREDAPEGPLVLLGHSMGSFISLYEQTDAPGTADALILSGSNVGGGALVKAGTVAAKVERMRSGRRGKSGVLAFMSFGSFNKAFEPTRTEFDWLSRDEAQVDLYVDDPRCGFRCTNQLWIDLTTALYELGDEARLRRLPDEMPVYLIAGDRDPVSDGGKGVTELGRRLRGAGSNDVTVKLYPEARHEVFNETNRAEVFAELLAFIDRATS